MDQFANEITCALDIKDLTLFQKLGELDSMIATYKKLNPVFSEEFDSFVRPHQSGVSFELSTGKFEGDVEISFPQFYRLLDIQLSIINTAFKGISHSLYVIDAVTSHLKNNHDERIEFSHPMSDEEVKDLRSSLADYEDERDGQQT